MIFIWFNELLKSLPCHRSVHNFGITFKVITFYKYHLDSIHDQFATTLSAGSRYSKLQSLLKY